jgi:hypothetical protein
MKRVVSNAGKRMGVCFIAAFSKRNVLHFRGCEVAA